MFRLLHHQTEDSQGQITDSQITEPAAMTQSAQTTIPPYQH